MTHTDAFQPSDSFVEQVKHALGRLFDFPALHTHPLTQALSLPTRGGEPPGQRLRLLLMSAIETLGPDPHAGLRDPHARLYHLLHQHYVEGLSVQEAADMLGISLRQAHRDLRRGEEGVAAVLWAQRPEASYTQRTAMSDEVTRMSGSPRPTEIGMLLQRAHSAVERLASQRGLTVPISQADAPVYLATDAAVGQQAIVRLLSFVIRHACPGEVRAELARYTDHWTLSLTYQPEQGEQQAIITDEAMMILLGRLGWVLRAEPRPDGKRAMVLELRTRSSVILIIDDNSQIGDLFERYLTGQRCQIVATTDPREGVRLARELLPSAVVLDVMMPDIDGWAVLQELRMSPATSHLPVIVCSVFHDPDLAMSLDADLVLPKPVSQAAVLHALQQLHVV